MFFGQVWGQKNPAAEAAGSVMKMARTVIFYALHLPNNDRKKAGK